jgi:hypothetical protein
MALGILSRHWPKLRQTNTVYVHEHHLERHIVPHCGRFDALEVRNQAYPLVKFD